MDVAVGWLNPVAIGPISVGGGLVAFYGWVSSVGGASAHWVVGGDRADFDRGRSASGDAL